MASIARKTLDQPVSWSHVAHVCGQWLSEQGVDLRSAVMLVPFAQHLAPARRAWAQRGGWQVRVETTRTLAASLGPAPRAMDGQLSLDATTDRLNAARLLRTQSWVRRDPMAFDEAVAAVVNTAHALARAAAAVEPDERADFWQKGRELLASPGGPGGTERGLARLALEWAATGPAPGTDRVFAHRPSAWLVVQAGGGDPLVQRVIERSQAPALVLDADETVLHALGAALSLAACSGFEDEAESAAAQVLVHLRRGEAPVALVAQDRVLVRRVRALLERQGVNLLDETGWTLSTTRAAAQVMGLLRAAGEAASTDALLDWLKAGGRPGVERAVSDLEDACRRAGWSRAAAIDTQGLTDAAAALLHEARSMLQPLAAPRRQALAQWVMALQGTLAHSGMLDALCADPAGGQVLRQLRVLDAGGWCARAAAQTLMTLDEFSAWADGALEDAAFVPEPQPDPSVILLPLGRLMLRPFAAVVFPGADDRHLGAAAPPQPLLSETQALALGVPTTTQRREGEALAFAHALSAAPVTLLYRRSDGADPLSLSPLVEQRRLRLERAGRPVTAWVDPRVESSVAAQPLSMPAPSAPQLLPARLSASACEALRACPYRFYALHLLRAREADELGEEIEQRDYGTWLHAVLMTFHAQRGEPESAEAECERLLAIAHEERLAQGLDEADFLPFEAGFAELAPRYVAWLHERDAQGARWWQGEVEREISPPGWQGVRLFGRIDRMDHVRGERGPAVELIDYKTGNASGLRDKLKQPLEDTQLAFYAALMQPELEVPLQASYLALGRKIEDLPHPDVDDSARALVDGLGADLARIRAGAGLPALGEAPTCDYCEARGLCRRDHWTSTP